MTKPNNLPLQLTSFIGREREIAEVKRLLTTTRLLTLTGSGGCGKTRLAIRAAEGLLDEYADGAWFVDLAPLSDPALVPQAIASVFDLHESGKTPIADILINYLRTRNLLLVLDNCEHLIQSCAEYSDRLLRACPKLKILATSREALNIGGETAFRVPSLSIPDPLKSVKTETLNQYESVRLFVERANAARPDLQLNDANASAIAQICARLDGIPLAIELAAARVNSLSFEQIASRLDDRFQLLSGGSRVSLARQQSLLATVDWSYDLLPHPEQILFRRLAVFAGGWTLEAAETVCSGDGIDSTSVLGLQSRLVEKSLVVAEGRKGEARCHMLETIRQYAHEKSQESGEGESVRNRHLEYFVKLAEEAEPKLRSPERREWLDRLDVEHDNLRAALEWSMSVEGVERRLRLGGALNPFWLDRGYWSEGYRRLVDALKNPSGSKQTVARGKALIAAGVLANLLGHSTEWRPLFEESLQILRESGEDSRRLLVSAYPRYSYAMVFRDPGFAQALAEEGIRISRETDDRLGLAMSLSSAGIASMFRTHYVAARSFFQESAEKYQALGDEQGYVNELVNLGNTSYFEGNLEKASEFYQRARIGSREKGLRRYEAVSTRQLGAIALQRGGYEEARTLLNSSLVAYRELNEAIGQIFVLSYLGRLELARHSPVQAQEYLKESLVRLKNADLKHWLPYVLEALAYLAVAITNPERAARLFGMAETVREQMGTPIPPVDRNDYDKYLTLTRAQLDSALLKAMWAEGRAMTMEQAIEYALQSQPVSDAAAPPLPPTYPAGLTEREVEVLRWLVGGLSNQEIADKLVLSKRTVDAHLRSIYGKLDVTTRSAATRAAIDHKIVRS